MKKKLNGMTYMHKKKVSKIPECNLLHHILNVSKGTKI